MQRIRRLCQPHKWQRNFEQSADHLLIHLAPDEPYKLIVNGTRTLCHEGYGWGNRARSILKIQATSTPDLLSMVGVLVPLTDPAKEWTIAIPVLNAHALTIHLDGQLIADEPGRAGE